MLTLGILDTTENNAYLLIVLFLLLLLTVFLIYIYVLSVLLKNMHFDLYKKRIEMD